jgi:hypothetical protein
MSKNVSHRIGIFQCDTNRYNPKGRHWLKVKRNYLKDEKGNSMVDSLDLVVLGG